MAVNKQDQIQHFFNRAGFSASQRELAKAMDRPLIKTVEHWFAASDEYLGQDAINVWNKGFNRTKTIRNNGLEKKQWYRKMVMDAGQIREKMVLFWHGHFAARTILPAYRKHYIDTLRYHALGNFKDFVLAIAKSPAMLDYLNNQQNKKEHPNENFARELLELFTIGRGHYSEKDIQEAARAFTGWSHDAKGKFIKRKFQHDNDSKTFFGVTGNLDGEDIVDIVLKDKRTAEFITTKVYKYFVSENLDEARINTLANSFYQSDYDIKKLMYSIFSADWFYEEELIGARIKAPAELMVGLLRTFEIKPNNIEAIRQGERSLGQVLLAPPNVAGWPEGRHWLDASKLLFRLSIPEKIFKSREFSVDWSAFLNGFESTKSLENFLLQVPIRTKIDESVFAHSSQHEKLKALTIAIIASPEFQLC